MAGGARPVTAGAVAALVLLAIVWGGSIPATKLGLADFSPIALTALRYLAAAPLFAALVARRPIPRVRHLVAMAAVGLLGVGVGQLSQTLGVARSSAAVATVISATIPGFVVLLAAIRLHQPIRAVQALGLAGAFAGVGVVVFGGSGGDALAGNGILGDALVLLSSVAVAAYYVLGAELVRRHGALIVAAWSNLGGALAMIPVLAWDWSRVAPAAPGARGIGVVIYLALLVTVAGTWVWLRALDRMPARIAASLQYLQPLVGVAASAALFGDPIGLWFAVGTAIVLAGIALGTLPAPARSPSRLG